MTKKEAFALFKEQYPTLLDGHDKPARDQAWNDFTDALCKEGEITAKQYATWTHPFN